MSDKPPSRRGFLKGLVGGAALTALPIAQQKADAQTKPTPPVAVKRTFEEEAISHLKSLWTAERAYFAERDRYTSNLRELGFEPDAFNEDGAKMKEKVDGEKTAASAHYIYSVELDDRGFIARARGAVGDAKGIEFELRSFGEDAGVPKKKKG